MVTSSAMADGDDSSTLIEKKREFLDSFFRKGAEFTRELLAEIDRLRRHQAVLEDELERQGRPQPSGSTLSELAAQIHGLAAERDHLRARLENIDSDDRKFSARYAEIERENNDLASLFVAQSQLHSTLVVSEVIQVITEILLNFVGASRFGILLVDAAGRPRVLATEAIERARADELVDTTSVVANVLASGRSHIGPLPEGGQSEPDPIVCFPLRQGSRLVGAVAVWGVWIQKQELSELDRRMFDLIATSGGHALEAARLAAHSETTSAPADGGPYEVYSALLQ